MLDRSRAVRMGNEGAVPFRPMDGSIGLLLGGRLGAGSREQGLLVVGGERG